MTQDSWLPHDALPITLGTARGFIYVPSVNRLVVAVQYAVLKRLCKSLEGKNAVRLVTSATGRRRGSAGRHATYLTFLQKNDITLSSPDQVFVTIK